MKITSYGSSSAGNCYFVDFEVEHGLSSEFNILIDIGVNITTKRSDPNFIKFSLVRYLFITHEHIDHTKYLKQFLEFNNLATVIIHPECLKALYDKQPSLRFYQNRFQILMPPVLTYERLPLDIKNTDSSLKVYPIKVEHNSKANNGYFITLDTNVYPKRRVFFITDCGSIKVNQFIDNENISAADIYLIESNHPEGLIAKDLKTEIQTSPLGHFNSKQALQLVDFLKRHVDKNIEQKVVWIHTSSWFYETLSKTDPFGFRFHPTNTESVQMSWIWQKKKI
ncbi:MBL fold metallo-hydrolase [Mycoplasmopsis bovis]|uniref:MBL fold metallo-hydrolase n=1 Tax=Mycoplasmopsis bovis TaxID=28903 RepID=A0ABY8RY52_MYCBV|nr:MBL fold metallo-hydrolase [Mycoplasmopsis bovis]AXJ68525.1 hypothetical protein CH319_02205 [Mycoplasmopsis bovis]AXJ74194.1 hypothetical protein CH315_02245 [Mycoplasmopsis bovis]MBT1316227.1 hypothetical protein [Mycoplasmopsis bovis]MBT1317346.1 hypothetical protein [Mycoplasmopsis bovis]MBT1363059.1 hypothetical protein [Mycoplasmopsis bovis]